MSRLTTQALEEHLWHLFDIMSETGVPVADCYELLVGLIVLKAAVDRAELGDEWSSPRLLLASGGEPPRSHALRRNRPEAWEELASRRERIGLGEVTSLADAVSKANSRLERVLKTLLVAGPAPTPWDRLVEHLSRFRLDPASLEDSWAFGFVIERLIIRSSEATRSAGELTTRPEVARLLAELANLAPAMSVYDPASGACQLLVESARAVARSGGDPASLHLSGTEIDAGHWAIGRAHLWACGLDGEHVVHQDALREPRLGPFDRIVCQPPFGPRELESESPAEPLESMFLERIVAALGLRGRAAVMLPEQFLYRKRTLAGRRQLIDKGILEAVIRLAPRLLFSSAVPVCILVLDRARVRSRVVFATPHVSGEGVDGEELAKLIASSGRERGSRMARVVSKELIAGAGFSFDPDRFFDGEVEQDSIEPLVDTSTENPKLFMTPSVMDALTQLIEASRQGGIVNLVGDYGTGKSTLCRELRDRLIAAGASVVAIDQPTLDAIRSALAPWKGREGRFVLIVDEWERAVQYLRPRDAAEFQRLLHIVLTRGPMSAVVFTSIMPLADMHDGAASSLFSAEILARTRTVRLSHNFREGRLLEDKLRSLRNSLVHSGVPQEIIEQVVGGLAGLSLQDFVSAGGPEKLARDYVEIESWGRFLRELGRDHDWILTEAAAQGFDLNDHAASFAAFIWRTGQRPASFAAALVRPSDLKKLFPAPNIMRRKEDVFADAFAAWCRGG